jgi:hypothetical protein
MLPASFQVHRSFGLGSNFYHHSLANGFPGYRRMMPFLSKSKSVARTSLEFNPLISTSSSPGFGPAALRGP